MKKELGALLTSLILAGCSKPEHLYTQTHIPLPIKNNGYVFIASKPCSAERYEIFKQDFKEIEQILIEE